VAHKPADDQDLPADRDQTVPNQLFFVAPLSLDKRLPTTGIFTVFPCAPSKVRMLFCAIIFRQNPFVGDLSILAFLLRRLDWI
jgi:hypothetical protein